MANMDQRCPICEGDMDGCSFTCRECWGKLSRGERDAYITGNPPPVKPRLPTQFSKATYDMVAEVLSTVKRDHYEFGAQKALYDKLVSTFMERFHADNKRFSPGAFADAAFRDAGPTPPTASEIAGATRAPPPRVSANPPPPIMSGNPLEPTFRRLYSGDGDPYSHQVNQAEMEMLRPGRAVRVRLPANEQE